MELKANDRVLVMYGFDHDQEVELQIETNKGDFLYFNINEEQALQIINHLKDQFSL